MDKNDFDIDFDFEKELGFDPKEFLDSDQDGDLDQDEFKNINLDDVQQDDFDLSQFGLDEELQEEPAYDAPDGQDPAGDEFMDYDMDSEDAYGNIPEDDYGKGEPPYREDLGYDEAPPYDNDPRYDEDHYDDEEILRRPRREYDEQAGYEQQPGYDEQTADPAYDQQPYGEPPYEEGPYAGQQYDESAYDQGDYQEEKPKKKGFMKKDPNRPKREFKKPTMPPFFQKFISLYFGPMIAEMSGMTPEAEGKRRRSKQRIFKEVYLPPLILFVTCVMVLSCIVGSVSSAVRGKLVHNEEDRLESIHASEEADRQAQEYQNLLAQAELYAKGYDYDKAIETLNSYTGEPNQDLTTLKAAYAQAQKQLVEVKDIAGIPNLSFHLLIADPSRAFTNKELGGKYNQNFVTIDEFQKILDSLYSNGYVLVDFDSFVEVSVDLNGKESFHTKPILLPSDKKPVMITETLVNYLGYMIDGNKDNVPDAQGAGFASRLVVDAAGDIKAEMVDKDGNTVVGDYDLVPILETFLKTHPDFSYRGARATLAVTGEEGIFGYRINTEVISDPKRGQAYYDQQVDGAKEVVAALKDKGYTLASFTYGNRNYGKDNANLITEDLTKWDNQIVPVMGGTNVMIFAQEADIGDYTGTKYKALYEKGFRYFVSKSDKPYTDVTNSYVRQKRLMVNGSNMAWYPNMFAGMFDCNSVMNSLRGDVPKAK